MDKRVSRIIQILDDYVSSLSAQISDPSSRPTYSGEVPTLESLALSVNLSETRLRALFKDEMGMTPSQYLKRLKMREALDLAQKTNLTVKEILNILQVGDQSHFMRKLKKEYRVTITECRRQPYSSSK